MAITNAQQFKQLVNPPMDGKRPGYRGDAAAKSTDAGRSGRADPGPRGDPGDGPASRDFGGPERERRMGDKGIGKGRDPRIFGGDSDTSNLKTFIDTARKKVNPFGRLTELPGGIGIVSRFLTPNPFGFQPKPFDAQGFGSGESGGPQGIPYWAQLGFSSEAEYLASLNKDEEQEPEYVNPLSKLSPRIAGSRFAAAGGGIASLEDMDREGFLLGGIAKGLKKAVRGIKKLAKSPIGKAALTFAAIKFGGPLAGKAFPSTFGSAAKSPFLRAIGRGQFFGDTGIFSAGKNLLFGTDAGIRSTPGLLSKFPGGKIGAGIFAASAAAGAMTPKEDEDKFDLDSYYASGKLNPSLSTRMMGSDFDFYGGQRIASAEGGSTDKEPVAKKTMPLLDMGGKEMDLRENGGFVPIGRMEKADDVPARLSKNEFVFTADAVRNAGDGDVDKGAEVMYNMMKNLEAGGEVSEESQGLEGARKMFQTSQRLEEVL